MPSDDLQRQESIQSDTAMRFPLTTVRDYQRVADNTMALRYQDKLVSSNRSLYSTILAYIPENVNRLRTFR